MDIAAPDDEAVDRFWTEARARTRLGRRGTHTDGTGPSSPAPPAWAFGADRATADELADLVLAGTKTATTGALWEWQDEGAELPRTGDLAVVCDGDGQPRALVRTTGVEVVAFSEVDAEHAAAEGEGDLSLTYWREAHEAFFMSALEEHGRGFTPDLQLVLERFELLYP